jgi:hypothetical protein
MNKLEDIKNKIKKTKVCFTYKISSSTNYKLIFKSDGKNEAYNQIKEKYLEPEKLSESTYFIIGKITFHSGTKFAQGGPIALNLNVVAFDGKKLVNVIKSQSSTMDTKFSKLKQLKGVIWFDKTFLEKKGWDNKYIEKIIGKLIKEKTTIVQRMIYHVEF